MTRVFTYVIVVMSVLAMAADAQAQRFRFARSGCSDPCASASSGGCATTTAACSPQCEVMDASTTAMKIVMVPEYTTETRSVCCTEYKEEERTRPVTVRRTVPVTEDRVRFKTVYVPVTETKTVEYTVKVPVQTEKTFEYTSTVPVWTEEEEQYTVKVPVLVDVEEQYTVKVPVLEDCEFNYTVQVPHPTTRTLTRTVSNVVPVTKTRTIAHCVPEVKSMLVKKDYGRWETRVASAGGNVQFASCSSCGGCDDCDQCASTSRTACRKVWVPNCVEEEVTVVQSRHQTQEVRYVAYEQQCEEVPYECVSVCYKPETRTATKKVVCYVDETRTRTRQEVEYVDETRTRTKKVLTFVEEPRTETYPVISYAEEIRTKEVSYTYQVPEQQVENYTVTRQDCVEEKQIETYTVKVPVPVVKEVSVQVCRMVPKVVTVEINPCGGGACRPAVRTASSGNCSSCCSG